MRPVDPLRSEEDAFRILLVVGAGALTVIAVALLFGSLPGFLWGLFLIGVGVGRLFRSRRVPEPTSRVAVVVDDVVGEELIAELREVEGEPEFLLAMVIAPGSPAGGKRKGPPARGDLAAADGGGRPAGAGPGARGGGGGIAWRWGGAGGRGG